LAATGVFAEKANYLDVIDKLPQVACGIGSAARVFERARSRMCSSRFKSIGRAGSDAAGAPESFD
jgi:hypothetical protein